MKLSAVRTEIEDEIRWQRRFHIEVEHRETRLWIYIQPPCEQMTDEVLEESPRCFLVAVFREIDEAEETRRHRIDNSCNSFGLHSRLSFGSDLFAEHYPFFRFRGKELLVDGTRQPFAKFESNVLLTGNE
ncbi:MAG: hypothetical protein DME21_01355 [Verrucomicrobia bacterium]|nr:MAG: hypothetical protein DME21_01355 [Verrucomicrobiota bacterium]